jgi:hypothetical protein
LTFLTLTVLESCMPKFGSGSAYAVATAAAAKHRSMVDLNDIQPPH